MRHHPRLTQPAAVAVVAALLLLTPLLGFAGPDVRPAPALQAGPDTLVGTVRALDAQKGDLSILTGTGLAVRTISFQVTQDTRTTAAGATLAARDLRPGDIVRVIGGARPTGRVAYTIERLARGPASERTP